MSVLPLTASATTRRSYCNREFTCTAIKTIKGNVRLLFGATTGGKHQLCVKGPRGKRTCKRFTLHKKGVWFTDVRWSAHFPNRGNGLYKVTWLRHGKQVGPALTFKRGS